jgi:nitrogen regulatory protein PII
MKLVIGIIKPFKLDEVCASLSNMDIQEINVVEVKGFGRQKGFKEHYHGAEFIVDFYNKIRLEVTVSEGQLAQTVETIQNAANSGEIGDGKIFIYEIN